jgi:hypothetical protein
MLAAKKLSEIGEQKRLLLAESEINRRLLAVHWRCATEPVRQLKAGYDQVASLRPYWVYLAPVAGFLLVRRRPRTSMASKFAFAWRMGKRLAKLWRFWESLPSREKRGTVPRSPTGTTENRSPC